MKLALVIVVVWLLAALAPPAAFAQAQGQGQGAAPAETFINSDSHEIDNTNEFEIYKGNFEYRQGEIQIYADLANYYTKQHRLVLTGNVVLAQGANRISADRADFNTDTKIGTFYNATGIATVQPPKPRPGAPSIAPTSNQPTDVYFFGDTIEKIGPRKYRITNGGFTTCVQPTPRWDLHAGTVVLNVDHYTLLKNAVLTVKGVPMLYVPVLYYPTKKDDRATGFLLPTYGSSSLRGQQIHNAFFWAIDRSQDATIAHEWYSKIGQGVAGEYRYNFGGGDDGTFTAHYLNQHETTYTLDDGSTSPVPAARSYDFRGGLNQALPLGMRARARVDYFSSITTSQTFNSNVYDASRNQRTYGGNVVGSWGGYSMNATFDRNEYFYNADTSSVSGSGPRVSVSRNERPLFGSALYFSLNGEYANLLYESKGIDATGPYDVDKGLMRFDITPQVRYPFKKWQWFTVNSTFSWRDTYYTRSYDPQSPDPNNPVVIDTGLNRRFFTAQSQIIGPVFNRIWDTPGNGYAEKFKHSVEPYLTVSRTSSIDDYARIVKIDGIDSLFGGVTQLQYGVTNRFFAKRRSVQGRPSVSTEILDVQIDQSYYTNPAASTVDPRYSSSFTTAARASNFSPVALTVRAVPTAEVNGSLRAEFDSRYHTLRTISATGTYAMRGLLSTSLSWSKTASVPVPGNPTEQTIDHYINANTTVHTRDNAYGGAYQFNYNIVQHALLQQRMTGYYNAQCCGIAFEYQNYSFGGISASTGQVLSDHRFFLSFTLAGLGNFSPFNGAMSGVPR
jgi:LPS-assembly protein